MVTLWDPGGDVNLMTHFYIALACIVYGISLHCGEIFRQDVSMARYRLTQRWCNNEIYIYVGSDLHCFANVLQVNNKIYQFQCTKYIIPYVQSMITMLCPMLCPKNVT